LAIGASIELEKLALDGGWESSALSIVSIESIAVFGRCTQRALFLCDIEIYFRERTRGLHGQIVLFENLFAFFNFEARIHFGLDSVNLELNCCAPVGQRTQLSAGFDLVAVFEFGALDVVQFENLEIPGIALITSHVESRHVVSDSGLAGTFRCTG
jgi:hypothetical protein